MKFKAFAPAIAFFLLASVAVAGEKESNGSFWQELARSFFHRTPGSFDHLSEAKGLRLFDDFQFQQLNVVNNNIELTLEPYPHADRAAPITLHLPWHVIKNDKQAKPEEQSGIVRVALSDSLRTSDVSAFLGRLRDDAQRKSSRQSYPGIGTIDTEKAFDVRLTQDCLSFRFKAHKNESKKDFKGQGELRVNIFFNDDLVLLVGQRGVPSMRADLLGNFLLTHEVKQRVTKNISRIKDVLSSITNDQARFELLTQLAKVEEAQARYDTMLPGEVLAILADVKKVEKDVRRTLKETLAH